MNAGTLSVKRIFELERQYRVPLYQRPYVWKRGTQWEPLWEDIRGLTERLLNKQETRAHFLGAIVLDQIKTPAAHLDCRLIIDGQQRLTTIQLVLEAFSDVCDNKGIVKYHKALLKLTRNDDPLSSHPDEQFKIWPTNVDQAHFRQSILAGSPGDVRTIYKASPTANEVGHPIADAYLYFHHQILTWLTAEGGQLETRVEALYTAVRDYLSLVVIDLGVEDDPQMIFETLNARGTPLLPSDLVKNFLFYRAINEKEELAPLYDTYWRPFDAESEYWRREIGRGSSKRARIDIFLQHYLALKKRDDVPAGHLYAEFRDHLTRNGGTKSKEHLKSLQSYAEIYKCFELMPAGTREALFFERLAAMDVGTAYPFLLELFARYGGDQEQRRAVLLDLESFLVRRMVCHLTARAYNRLFVDLLQVLDGDPAALALRVREFFLSSDAESTRWPDDAEFRSSWVEFPAYRVLVRSRVRMLFEALEGKLHTDKTEKLKFGEQLTIEHVMPVSWGSYWPLPSDVNPVEARDQRERAIHTLGNLTLLTKKLNPSVSNGAWLDKSKAIHKHSVLKLNLEVSDCPVWDEKAIRDRGEKLFKMAIELWPRPKKIEPKLQEDASL